MSEEEIKAIKTMKEIRARNLHTFVNELDIIFNLIERQQQELNKEKEKNKELNRLKGFEMLDIFNMGKESSRNRLKHDWVEKDKIRELQNKYKKEIEKLERKKIWNEPVDTINKNRYTNYYNAYEELLQEGDK